jgi:hypothetical protein
MNPVERFHAVMSFQPVDRLPLVEYAPYWDLTSDRWRREGLPAHLINAYEIREYLGLDVYRYAWAPLDGLEVRLLHGRREIAGTIGSHVFCPSGTGPGAPPDCGKM